MEYVALGRTNLMVSRSVFGTRLLTDVPTTDSCAILEVCYDGGINFFETSRTYSDVEKKLGSAFYSKRKDIIICSRSEAKTANDLAKDLDSSLDNLTTDFIDIYSITGQDYVPIPGSEDGLYNEMLHSRRNNKIKFIGLNTTNYQVAKDAINSGLYDVIQYPFNLLATESEIELVKLAEKNDIGFIATKTLASGKIENIPLAYGFLKQYENVISTWGAKNLEDIQKLLYFEANPPTIDEKFLAEIEELKKNLSE